MMDVAASDTQTTLQVVDAALTNAPLSQPSDVLPCDWYWHIFIMSTFIVYYHYGQLTVPQMSIIIIYNSTWSILIQWIKDIVRWQSDLENTKERPLHKPSQDQSKYTALGGVWNFAERCMAIPGWSFQREAWGTNCTLQPLE